MTTKFITLTRFDGANIYINPISITALTPSTYPESKDTYVYVFGSSDYFRVRESQEELMKLIQATDSMTIIQYDPKKP